MNRQSLSVWRAKGGAIAALAVIVALSGLTAIACDRPAFTMYDEGVYYYQAVLFSRGEVPYRDFFCPQPPGVLLLGAASERLGMSIVGARVVNWLCGLVLLIQTYVLTRRLSVARSWNRKPVAGCCDAGSSVAGVIAPGHSVAGLYEAGRAEGSQDKTPASDEAGPGLQTPATEEAEGNPGHSVIASVLVAVTVVFAYQSIQGATNMPAACLELVACLLVLGEGRRRCVFAGLLLAAATVLRLQAVVALPGLLLLLRVLEGRSGFWSRAAWLLGTLGIACAAFHLTLAAALPGYFDNVVGFQTARVRTDWSDRGRQVGEFLFEPVAVLGLFAALWFAVRGEGRLRGLALHAIATTGVITVAGNSLSVMYYLPVLPLLAACATVALCRLMRNPWALAAIPLVIAAIRGPWIATVILAQTALNDEHAACIARLDALPGETVLTSDGRIAVLAAKRLPADYYATDPNALYLLAPAKFHAWFATILLKADVVIITPQLLMWMSSENAAAVRKSGKPVLFDSRSTRDVFETTYGSIR